MTDAERIAEIRLFGDGRHSANATVLRQWLDSEDIDVMSQIFDTVVPNWSLIAGASREDYASFAHQLLVASLRRPAGSVTALPFVDASAIYLGWLKQLADESSVPEAVPLLELVIGRLAALYTAVPGARDRILNGVLEHAFELAPLRAYFENWTQDPVLAAAHRAAAEWADTQ